MSNIRPMPHIVDPALPVERQPVAEVIKRLESALEFARSGQLRSFALAGVFVNDDGSECTIHDSLITTGGHLLVAAMVYVQNDLVEIMTRDPIEVSSPPESA